MPKSFKGSLIGHRFGSLVVVQLVKTGPSGGRIWRCHCIACGGEAKASTAVLRNGGMRSCGCSQYATHSLYSAERNAEIADLHAGGKLTYREIALRYGLSRQRICAIVQKERERREKSSQRSKKPDTPRIHV
jgi:hypothetical protein